jgi:6-phosphogluconate dehydrogenase
MSKTYSDIGVIGLGVMGANLARNFAAKNYTVYNRTHSKTTELILEHGNHLVGYESIGDFVQSLCVPRKIVLMVEAGSGVDAVIAELLLYIDKQDIIVDCGNSRYSDTATRMQRLDGTVRYVGCGVSGGSQGALLGPSIMPSGEQSALQEILPFLEAIAAKDFEGKPCVTEIGKGASGHFVKMVHNGIEYGLMQAISEVYAFCRCLGYTQQEMIDVFGTLNTGLTQSYLLEITEKILQTKDSEGDTYLLDMVSPIAHSKGTGGWMVQAAIDLGVGVSIIASSVFARFASTASLPNSQQNLQTQASKTRPNIDIEQIQKALESVFLVCFVQGLELIHTASNTHKWDVDICEVLRIWQGGCIIRSQVLLTLTSLYNKAGELNQAELNMLLNTAEVKQVVDSATIPIPVFSASYQYMQMISHGLFGTNLIQAQRDYFGSHTYRRIDKAGDFTGGWLNQ